MVAVGMFSSHQVCLYEWTTLLHGGHPSATLHLGPNLPRSLALAPLLPGPPQTWHLVVGCGDGCMLWWPLQPGPLGVQPEGGACRAQVGAGNVACSPATTAAGPCVLAVAEGAALVQAHQGRVTAWRVAHVDQVVHAAVMPAGDRRLSWLVCVGERAGSGGQCCLHVGLLDARPGLQWQPLLRVGAGQEVMGVEAAHQGTCAVVWRQRVDGTSATLTLVNLLTNTVVRLWWHLYSSNRMYYSTSV